MNKQEFEKIEKEYYAEKKRWESLKVGQKVYEEFPRFFDMEYFKLEIVEIDVDNRKAKVLDHSQNGKERIMSHFSTIEELKERGIEFVEDERD